ncbi:viral (Super1) RNA helicase family protein [Chlamydia ibidis]|uniref:ATP-dependent RecD2 DNA helicase n=2 Tax=Chlamydia ibidis TaxID=1405396 RepID=S7J3M5_9CHLA|nr:ATP-dependent RecD-like DNA helicase [Chlamydia ibidis]EPP35029.1 viral (Super1) RNA helicase family protein [Chlamydia ibidis]EQM62776.1 hypothetical protein H359_0699 [Chlamydia ibidis 10-1398/6]
MQRISGILGTVLSTNQESEESVIEFVTPYNKATVTVLGKIPKNALQRKELISLYGVWWNHPTYGESFKVFICDPQAAPHNQGIINYLSSKLVKGIGVKTTTKILKEFGECTADILDYSPEKLDSIPGISKARCTNICSQLNEQKSLRTTLLFLQQYDIPIHYGIRIHRKYQDHSIMKILQDPFILARDVDGIGFKTADLIAIQLRTPLNSPNRIGAGILHSLKELQEEGHTCYALDPLVLIVHDLLNQDTPELLVTREEILEQINTMIRSNLICTQNIDGITYVWTRSLFFAEKTIVSDIKRILYSTKKLRSIDEDKAISWVEENLNLDLEHIQKQAVRSSLTNKLHIITGGPGTGKSTITKAILKIYERLTHKIILAAPTGKAAKRITEITNKNAVTIHVLLQYDFSSGTFRKCQDNPIDCDLIIIDESGMMDTYLLHHLLHALPDHVVLILIGDVHQLPSIGPGNILKDLIDSQKITVSTLSKVFRQVHDSNIIINAHKVNQGDFPILYGNSGRKDFLFFQHEDPEEALKRVVSLVTEVVPKKFHIQPKDIQVLSPMKKGILGIHNLNSVLREELNSQKVRFIGKLHSYAVGDKVMQIRNNYRKRVFNGDIGYITSIDFGNKQILVKIEDRLVNFLFSELDNLILAYATSVHKYQGSESPCVIIPIHTSHYVMLYRNLLYTAITRGKKLVILVGTKKAISIAVKNNKVLHRSTGLVHALNSLEKYQIA